MKKIISIFSSAILFTSGLYAQTEKPCFTDEMHQRMIQAHPEIVQYDEEMERQIKENLKKIDFSKVAAKETNGASPFYYDIPIVIHVIHNYGSEDVTDSAIFAAYQNWNVVYSLENYDTADVIAPFKNYIPNSSTRYIGNPLIRLHLATLDPYGNPTHGITRRRSYLTYSGGENAKFDDWPPSSYVNIWFVDSMCAADNWAAAYAHFPSDYAAAPFYDGVIALYNYMANNYGNYPSKTINHEIGHVFSLYHPWGATNYPGVSCGDDQVDDTPPTLGHGAGTPGNVLGCVPFNIYDTNCATGYVKVYPSSVIGIDSLVDYPDTTNAQNIMDYTYCAKMFTNGQVMRMHAALNSSLAYRNNLWSPANLSVTGTSATNTWPDLTPVPDFSVDNNYPCVGTEVILTNFSWNDTVQKIHWTFSNGAQPWGDSTLDDKFFYNPTTAFAHATFSQPGWVTVTMRATGNGTSGTGILVDSQRIFAADTSSINANNYVEEFNSDGDVNKWPTFNYFNNEFKWQIANVGYDDNACMQYTGYDNRINVAQNQFPITGVPKGDYDDMYTPYFDLSTLSGGTQASLNFMYSGATRSNNAQDINDVLEIWYCINSGVCNPNWLLLTSLSQTSLCNQGTVSTYYTPSSQSDWALQSIPLNKNDMASAKKIAFRFRYRPGVNYLGYQTGSNGGTEGYSTGNNFYIDRINFSSSPLGLNTLLPNQDHAVVVAPNPTKGDAYIIVKDADNVTLRIQITDISGRIIYSAQQQTSGNITNITIPKSIIPTSGIYLVNIATPNQTRTEKLVVY